MAVGNRQTMAKIARYARSFWPSCAGFHPELSAAARSARDIVHLRVCAAHSSSLNPFVKKMQAFSMTQGLRKPGARYAQCMYDINLGQKRGVVMSWDIDLLPEQQNAASYIGSHARLLAGPGTGKTLTMTRRVVCLIQEEKKRPDEILILTFTRAAVQELRQRISSAIGEKNVPRISTLHSFALRQLLRNVRILDTVPIPLRIADDWEEKEIIFQDIKKTLGFSRVDMVEELFSRLSADWERLIYETSDWNPDPKFIGAWRSHREIFGYTLRSELVYQLKRALEQSDEFAIESEFGYLLVDEYQDLNCCDLAVIKKLTERGMELFVAGDDDQSIYGFRQAHPQGIRQFTTDYPGSVDFTLQICKRCDQEILSLSEFVAQLDPRRIPKRIIAEEGRTGGEVAILRFRDQVEEAAGVANLCKQLIEKDGLAPHDILVLLRVDTHKAFSKVLINAFNEKDIPVSSEPVGISLFESSEGRIIMALLRLLINERDDLAWRTLIMLRKNGIGEKAIEEIINIAQVNGIRFFDALRMISDDPKVLSRFGKVIRKEINEINNMVNQMRLENENERLTLEEKIINIVYLVFDDDIKIRDELISYLIDRVIPYGLDSIAEIISIMDTSVKESEQEIQKGKVNILTMHKAKGLTAEAVIVVGAEDQYIPGRQTGENEGDERRLLYVSLTRAKHMLFITYCQERFGQQRRCGREGDTSRRELTRFLRDSYIKPVRGMDYIKAREKKEDT